MPPKKNPEDLPKGGRPTDYRPEYCQRVIDMGAKGYSVVEMCAEIGVDRKTLERVWPEAHEEFFQAFNLSRLKSQAWWESIGRNNIIEEHQGPKVNAGLYGRSMAARFPDDWRESSKTELTGANGDPLVVNVMRFGESK